MQYVCRHVEYVQRLVAIAYCINIWIMDTPPPAKRLKAFTPSSQLLDIAQKIMMEVMDITFPWEEAVPPNVKEWIKVFAKSHNTAPASQRWSES